MVKSELSEMSGIEFEAGDVDSDVNLTDDIVGLNVKEDEVRLGFVDLLFILPLQSLLGGILK